ncbi:MAG: hypothetical protein HN542_11035 [Flavobacteriales bacterium]|nr:hypothetical protein [Flavobacteriales bacterium]NCG30985.1 hypothetical protein [Bacteroidota bacterium]MBT4704805.1 hypothetical protein [Flavobacteriales bacterium]MBT4929447.1 hypothetical protein [Flavobacteriales bacterium]MBT5133578.1 hypothetical protein [Flavobacteriales bacterium]
MKKHALVLICTILIGGISLAQNINPEIFKKNTEVLYEAAADGFNQIKLEQDGESSSGDLKFRSARKVSGATDVHILVDKETTHTYYAIFQGIDLEEAKKKVDEMVALMREVLAEKGLVHTNGTDINYEGYRKQTFQYDSDNIDLLGKYPSFALGIVRGSEPPIIEMTITEPLWK